MGGALELWWGIYQYGFTILLMQQLMNQCPSSIRPAPQKMILTIDTSLRHCRFFFTFCLTLFITYTLDIWLAICATSRCRSLEPLVYMPSIFLQMIPNLNSLNDSSTDEEQRQSVVLSNTPESLFFKEWWSGKYCCSTFLIYPYLVILVANFCKASLSGDL